MRGRKVDVVVLAPGERIRDAEGRWKATGDGVVVRAHVAPAAGAVNRREDSRERAGRSERGEGVVLLPRGTPLDTSHRVVLGSAGVLPDGTYAVRAITRTAKHVRVSIDRVEP